MNSSRITLFVAMALVGVAVYLGTRPEAGALEADRTTHFAIGDTSQVTKHPHRGCAGTSGRSRTLLAPVGTLVPQWPPPARKDATDLLLKTFKRISVRQPVQTKAKEGVLKMMAASGKRVDIHLDGAVNGPAKTWFIGTPTQSHTGTHMLLELPGEGRSSEPYITHMEGLYGLPFHTLFHLRERMALHRCVREPTGSHPVHCRSTAR